VRSVQSNSGYFLEAIFFNGKRSAAGGEDFLEISFEN
jgi:hypothetical protein